MSEPFVRADVRAFLDGLAANPRPAFTAEVLAAVRTMPADAMAPLDMPVGELARVEDFVCDGERGRIALRLYDARTERAAGPVVVFFHGGGFVVGSIDTHAGIAAALARGLDLPVVSVEYRLAPEHPWPAAPDDAEEAARWVAANGTKLGLEANGLVLCGDSAGGNLAIVTALALRDRPADLPVVFQWPIYPASDHVGDYASRRAFAQGYGLDAKDTELFAAHYGGDLHHWRRSPLLADLTGLPPALVITAALDPLRDEGRAYAAKLVDAGVDVAYVEARGLIHGFASYRRAIPSAAGDFDRLIALASTLIESQTL